MGKEAEVSAVLQDGPDQGRLQYEPPRLIFRGRARQVFEGAALAGVRAEAGDLVLANGARFALGERAAASWAEAITNPKGRLDKLGIKPGQRVAVKNLDDPAFVAELQGKIGAPPTDLHALDILFYGADSPGELARIADLIPSLADRGALWVVSLKGKLARVKDVDVMAAAKAAGLVDNKVCAVSNTRTALRFVRRR
ncbi:MAG TPA: DUF3052 family protein [Caulobacteraceae bacterium]